MSTEYRVKVSKRPLGTDPGFSYYPGPVPDGFIFKDRARAEQYGQQRVDAVQLHDRWYFTVEEREVTDWSPSPTLGSSTS